MKGKEKKAQGKSGGDQKWVIRIFCVSVALSAVLSFLSSEMLEGSGYLVAFAVLIFFILLGIAFDIIGVAVTAADPRPFHSMAAHKEKGASQALMLLKNAGRVSNFCNDVVGDICGIVSGATAAVIVARLEQGFNLEGAILTLTVTALISGFTIGGKALGKNFAITQCTDVVYFVARIMNFLHMGR